MPAARRQERAQHDAPAFPRFGADAKPAVSIGYAPLA
jgi:hypothetical protein